MLELTGYILEDMMLGFVEDGRERVPHQFQQRCWLKRNSIPSSKHKSSAPVCTEPLSYPSPPQIRPSRAPHHRSSCTWGDLPKHQSPGPGTRAPGPGHRAPPGPRASPGPGPGPRPHALGPGPGHPRAKPRARAPASSPSFGPRPRALPPPPPPGKCF